MAQGSTYYVDVRHRGLNKYRRITGSDRGVVEEKAARQRAIWVEQHEKKLAADEKRHAREAAALEREAKKELAAERTEEAEEAIATIEGILAYTLDVDGSVDWDSLKRTDTFRSGKPVEPEPSPLPIEPQPHDPEFRPRLGLIDRLIPSLRAKKEQDAAARHDRSRQEWEQLTTRIKADFQVARDSYREALAKWEADRAAFDTEKSSHNQAVDDLKAAYQGGSPEAIEEYCDLALSNSVYPESFPSEFEMEYRAEGRILLVDYQLPGPDAIPRLRQVKYVQTRDEFSESLLSEAAFNKLYDGCLYQLALRTPSTNC